jgi:hypothetical protein
MPFKGFGKFFEHIRADDSHSDELWERFDEKNSQNSSDREVPWEGFSTEASFEGFSSPPAPEAGVQGQGQGEGLKDVQCERGVCCYRGGASARVGKSCKNKALLCY